MLTCGAFATLVAEATNSSNTLLGESETTVNELVVAGIGGRSPFANAG